MIAPRPGSPLKRLPAFLGLLALAVFCALSLSTSAATRFYQWPWFFYWQVLLAAPIAVLGCRLIAARRPQPRLGGLLDAGLVLAAAAATASALASPFRPQSLTALLIPLAAVAFAYLCLGAIEGVPARRAARSALAARLLGALMALFAVVSLAGWLGGPVRSAFLEGQPASAAFASRNEAPLGHSVYTAAFAVLAAPWLAALGLRARGWRRAAWLTAGALALAIVPTTASRGGALAAAVEITAAGGLWLARRGASPRRRWIAAAVLVLAAAGIAADPRLRYLVVHGRWSEAASESNRQREAMLQAGWRMGCARPATGYGPGTVPLVYPRYRAGLAGGVDNVLELHSTPAQVWAEGGLAGVLAAALLLAGAGALAWRLFRIYVKDTSSGGMPVAGAAAAIAGAGYAAISLVDYNLDVPLFAAVAVALLVLARGCAADGPVPVVPAAWARALGAFLLAALAATLLPVCLEIQARGAFAAGADARLAGDTGAFIAGADAAATLAPWEPFFLVQLAAFEGDRSLVATDPAARRAAEDRCRALLVRALAVDADQTYCHFNLGWLQLRENPAEAETHFRAAARLSPYRGGVYLGVGLCRLARNDRDGAAAAFALEWLNDPRAMTSPYWEAPPLQAMRGEVVAALRRISRDWDASGALRGAPRDQVRYVGALAAWWGGDAGAAAGLAELGSPEQRLFFANLASIEARTFAPPSAGGRRWEPLYLAWRDGGPPPQAPGDEPPLAASMQARIARLHGSFAALLTAPVGSDAGLVRLVRNRLPGYSVLQRNQDGFLLADLYIFPENALVARYVSFLFPPKGYLSSRLLLRSLDETAGAAP